MSVDPKLLVGKLCLALLLGGALLGHSDLCRATEPDPKTYWDIDDIRPGMKGIGRTVMVGTKLEEFRAEVLGVMRDVSPGRDMILCRLTGCNLEHAGIIQGMSGSPIYVDGKLMGAVAFAWEFAKDPIAGVTPFKQMVEYVRFNDRRIAAEAQDRKPGAGEIAIKAAATPASFSTMIQGLAADEPVTAGRAPSFVKPAHPMAGMTPIMTPLASSGFGPRALELLDHQLRPLGMAPLAGGAASPKVIREEGEKPLAPGSPLSIAMVTGDFDLSGIGTVTHVEGNRVYGFGHPMFSLGACEMPMMTGYIHTVYPRASVSMKMGSPLKVVGVIDTDVSTGVAGRIGPKPDMLPVSVKVKTGRYADPKTYRVEMIREPSLMPALIMSVLTNAIDTEGVLPEELTIHLDATIRLKGLESITMKDVLSGPRYTGQVGATTLFGPLASLVNILVKNSMTPVRIEGIDCQVEIESGRKTAAIESVRLLSDTIQPGQDLKAFVTVKPYKGERTILEATVRLPEDYPEGTYEAVFCDMGNSIRRRFRNEPAMAEPRDLNAMLKTLRMQTGAKRTALFAHVPTPERGVAVQGQDLPNLPGSARALFSSRKEIPVTPVRADLVKAVDTDWVLEGNLTLRFSVAKDTGLSLSSR